MQSLEMFVSAGTGFGLQCKFPVLLWVVKDGAVGLQVV